MKNEARADKTTELKSWTCRFCSSYLGIAKQIRNLRNRKCIIFELNKNHALEFILSQALVIISEIIIVQVQK